jgi:hypothetical protein
LATFAEASTDVAGKAGFPDLIRNDYVIDNVHGESLTK